MQIPIGTKVIRVGLQAFICVMIITLPLRVSQAHDKSLSVIRPSLSTTSQKPFDLMFRRGFYRPIERSPEDKRQYVNDGDGLLVQFGVTSVAQYADKSLTERHGLLNLTYEFPGAWRAIGNPEGVEGLLSWWIRGGRPIGAPEDADLSKDIGSVFEVNSTLVNAPFFVDELYWLQFFDQYLHLSIGRFDSAFRYDFNTVANDEREQFLASPLVNSPNIPFPNPGLGLNAWWNVSKQFYLTGGIHQANASQTSASLDKLRSDELFYALETGYSLRFADVHDGNYRFLIYYTEMRGKDGSGFSISFDQAVGEGLHLFLRYSIGDSDITDFQRFFSTGVGLDSPFNKNDMLGIGYAWGDPSEANLRKEQIIEIFYRYQIGDFVHLSPDIQVILDPGRNRSDDLIILLGLRLQATF